MTGRAGTPADFPLHQPEDYRWGRVYDAFRDRNMTWGPRDFRRIAETHRTMRAAIAPEAGFVQFGDGDPLLTSVWEEMLTGRRAETAPDDLADLYLLLDVDLPSVDDGTRYFGDTEVRRRFHQLCRASLERAGVAHVAVGGLGPQRLANAASAVATSLGSAVMAKKAEGKE